MRSCLFWFAFIILFILLLIFASPLVGGLAIFTIVFLYVNRRSVVPK